MRKAIMLESSIVDNRRDTEGYSAAENMEVFGHLGFV